MIYNEDTKAYTLEVGDTLTMYGESFPVVRVTKNHAIIQCKNFVGVPYEKRLYRDNKAIKQAGEALFHEVGNVPLCLPSYYMCKQVSNGAEQ